MIVQVIPSIARESSGPTSSVRSMVEGLNELGGWSTKIFCVRLNNEINDESFIELFDRDRFIPKIFCKSTKLLNRLNELYKDKELELVHIHGFWSELFIEVTNFCSKNEIPFIVSPRGSLAPGAINIRFFWKKLYWKLRLKNRLNEVGYFHATSDKEKSEVLSMFKSATVHVVPNTISSKIADSVSSQNVNENERVIAFLGRVHPIKGLDLLIEVWSEIHSSFPDWVLKIAGPEDDYFRENSYGKFLREKLGELGCMRIEFIGEITGANKFRFLRSADLLILPSKTENFGQVVLESLLCGTPVIASSDTPWRQLEDFDCGWTFERTHLDLKRVLITCLKKSSQELEEKGRNGTRYFETHFSTNAVVPKMIQTYEEIVETFNH